jgi:hypothetical protein
MKMYSHPMGFDESSLQSRMLGTRMDVLDLTVERQCQMTE